ncbi:MAG TPA: M23 family metallopeptidase [Bacteroidales bacterium]|nr:M23 family metallopeptidase [Bacteroidales bacterium]HPJ58575.1 M23 family metallopeptidase [Bacteroidales bacterium]HPR11266.1 M23 family metallopeptidase [Bacteroidales bacterium]HRW86539.1 M23 family metallopeptidase [Bacteroidales bacterium]
MLLIKLLLLYTIFCNTPDNFPKDRSIFISPVKIPLALSANFGELRSDHFHSGVDIKTGGVTGKEIVAAADGYVYRISITPGGFGKALYLKHPSGYSTVYGHLEGFIPEIDEYVKKNQYEKKSFSVSLFPPAGMFRFRQGDLVAWSGNTGSSSGPHLHYEIRKSDSEMPVNPLLFDFGTGDDIAPVIERLAVYPLSRGTIINGKKDVQKLPVSGGHGNYYLPSGRTLQISGPAGFGIKAYDLLNDSYNRCAVYSIEMKIDSVTMYRNLFDQFAFSETKYINAHIDYQTLLKEKTYYQKTFVLPNDKLSVYNNLKDRGIYTFNDTAIHHVEIIVTDVHNNISRLKFTITGNIQPDSNAGKTHDDGLIPMPYNRNNRFRAENITLTIPAGSLYDTLFFSYSSNAGTKEMYSDIHNVHNIYTPLHRAYSLSIKPRNIPEGREDKLLILQLINGTGRNSIGGSLADGYVTASASVFGSFCVGIDTVAPVISANGLKPGSDLSGRKELRIRITDDLSGINTYEGFIDGKWALFEYDQKNNLLVYKFDSGRIISDSVHSLRLTVTDKKNNESILHTDFRW